MCCEPDFVKKHYRKYKIIKKKFNGFVWLLIIITSILLLFTYFNRIVNPIIYSFGYNKISQMVATCSNEALIKVNKDITYSDIVDVYYNNGDISSITTNTNFVNKLSGTLATIVQKDINENIKLGIDVPFGTCTGIGFLSGKGSNINISIIQVGNTICNFYSQFVSAGINQTLHKIYIKIQTEVCMILPFKSENITKEVEVMVAENIIVGKIPEIYLAK